MEIKAATIPHVNQRYDTVGDYFLDGDCFKLWISETGNGDYNFLIFIHEIIEAYLCKRNGIPETDITNWDIDHPELKEPGHDENAPYHAEHEFAEKIERKIATRMGINWKQYEKVLDELY